MNFTTNALKGAALTAALMFGAASAHAMTVTHITDTDITDAVASEASYSFTAFDDIFVYNAEFTGTANGNQAIFTFTNNSIEDTQLRAGQSASVNPDEVFDPAATFSWDGGTETALDGGNVQADFAAGQTRTLTITYGASTGFAQVDVLVSAVPLPAGVLLMGTALAGFGALRRRKNKS